MAEKNIDSSSDSTIQEKPHRRNPLAITLKVAGWIVLALIVIVVGAVWVLSVYLSPERIVQLVEKESARYLNADIKIGNFDYRIWHTYPWLEFEVDSVDVISKSLDGIAEIQKKELPVYADSLVSIEKLQGKINIHSLLKDIIELRDIEIVKPAANIVLVTDSVTNFNILKSELPDKYKMPKLELSEIKVISPVDFNFFSLAENAEMSLEIEKFNLTKEGEETYNIGFDGIVNGRYHEYKLQEAVPLKFTTDITMASPDFSVALDNLSLSYGGIKLDVSGDINANQERLGLKDVEFNLSINDIFDVLHYLPPSIASKIKIPYGITGKIPIDLRARLLAPYEIKKDKFKEFSLQDMPLFSAVASIKDARLNLSPKKGKAVEADDIYMVLECNFDPFNSEHTTLTIAELRMKGEGISLEGMAHVSNITGEQQTFDGLINFRTPLAESLAYFLPSSPVNVAGSLDGDVRFSGQALKMGKKGVENLAVSGDLNLKSLKIASGKSGNVRMSNVKTDFRADLPSYPIKSYKGTDLDFNFYADSLYSTTPGANIYLGKLQVKLDAADTVAGTPDPYGTLMVGAKTVNLRAGANKFAANNLSLKAKGNLNSSGNGNYNPVAETSGGDDALIASRINHTPLVVEYEGGGILQTIMGMVDLDADIKIEKGSFKTPLYLYPIEFNGIELSSNLDNMKIQGGKIQLANTGLTLSGEMDGLKPFMTSFSPTPLSVSADINFTNVDINQLAWGYYGALLAQGIPSDSVFYVPPMLPMTAADSLCVAIPRNIDANLHLFSEAAQCLQYNFAPLSTDIIVKNGEATLKNLTVGAPYCTAVVDWTYSTTRLDNIFMNIEARVKNFEFSKFYPVFPSIINRAPELQNFTGELNADIGVKFNMYPDMFMNSQSLTGNFDIMGSHLQFAREGKIEKITHLMLIEGDTPIAIDNIDISGSLHDNLLEVNPFKIKFDDYQLGFGGLNNFAGDMYYHLALEKSPFHLPFGVTLKGKFSHPEVRMGGTHINNKDAAEVATNLSSDINVNIMAYLRHGWLLFIQEAAKYEGKVE